MMLYSWSGRRAHRLSGNKKRKIVHQVKTFTFLSLHIPISWSGRWWYKHQFTTGSSRQWDSAERCPAM